MKCPDLDPDIEVPARLVDRVVDDLFDADARPKAGLRPSFSSPGGGGGLRRHPVV
jgi:hypothetical protein